jgi:hypothetical protein
MRKNVYRLAAGCALAVGLALWLGRPSGAADAEVPADQYKVLVADEIDLIKDTAEKATLDKKTIGREKARLKSASLLIALYAQGAKGGDANLRDAAIEVAKAADALEVGAKTDMVKQKLANLKPGAPAPGVKTTDLTKLMGGSGPLFELHDVMTPFKAATGGGVGLEKYIRDTIKKVDDPKNVVKAGYKSAAIMAIAEQMPPQGVTGAKQKQWEKYAEESRKNALDLAAMAGGKGKDKEIMAAAKKLDGSCTTCHNTFRVD